MENRYADVVKSIFWATWVFFVIQNWTNIKYKVEMECESKDE